MNISPAGLAMTKRFEGLRLTAYRDSGGVLTIGYGHTGPDVQEGDTWTLNDAGAALQKDMQDAVASVNSAVHRPLTQCQFDALCDFAFNVGCGALRSSELLRKVEAGDFSGAQAEFGRWVHDRAGNVQPGLVVRREAEAQMFGGSQ